MTGNNAEKHPQSEIRRHLQPKRQSRMERRERAAFGYAVQRCVKRRFPVAHMSGVRHRKWYTTYETAQVTPDGELAKRLRVK